MKQKTIIGKAEIVNFPEFGLKNIPARIDTGAKTSSVWASEIQESDGLLSFKLFGGDSPHYSDVVIETKRFGLRAISSSNGAVEERYVVRLIVEIEGRKIRASFSLANRASQTYPVLVGRNVLRGKFVVDVKQGQPLIRDEKLRSQLLQSQLQKPEEKP